METGKKKGRAGWRYAPSVKFAARMMPLIFLETMTLPVMAGEVESAKKAIEGVLSIVYLITNVMGIIFVIVGFVRLVIAHSQEDAPGQQKAAMFIATGIALIAVRVVLRGIGFSDWVGDFGA